MIREDGSNGPDHAILFFQILNFLNSNGLRVNNRFLIIGSKLLILVLMKDTRTLLKWVKFVKKGESVLIQIYHTKHV